MVVDKRLSVLTKVEGVAGSGTRGNTLKQEESKIEITKSTEERCRTADDTEIALEERKEDMSEGMRRGGRRRKNI